jgi:hypothetical protein
MRLSSVMTPGRIETGKRALTNITERLRTGMRELSYNVNSASEFSIVGAR